VHGAALCPVEAFGARLYQMDFSITQRRFTHVSFLQAFRSVGLATLRAEVGMAQTIQRIELRCQVQLCLRIFNVQRLHLKWLCRTILGWVGAASLHSLQALRASLLLFTFKIYYYLFIIILSDCFYVLIRCFLSFFLLRGAFDRLKRQSSFTLDSQVIQSIKKLRCCRPGCCSGHLNL